MFFTYLRRELRRRSRQAVVISLGFALGIGLVITVIAASAGVKSAQGKVLHALYGYSHGEAAQMLGIAEGTCKAQLHRARKLLRERLHMEVN